MFPGLKTYLLFKFSIVLALVSFLINNAEAVVFKPFKQQTSFSQITQAPPVLRTSWLCDYWERVLWAGPGWAVLMDQSCCKDSLTPPVPPPGWPRPQGSSAIVLLTRLL